jgi:hypothetical protein
MLMKSPPKPLFLKALETTQASTHKSTPKKVLH